MLNPEPHRLLKRQLDKFLSFETEITPDLAELFRDISAAYQNYDQELDLMRRALDENSVELDGARRQIQAHLEEHESWDGLELDENQEKTIRGFRFLAQKPAIAVIICAIMPPVQLSAVASVALSRRRPSPTTSSIGAPSENT